MTGQRLSIEERVDHVIALLEASAAMDYIGEDISQLEHGLQCVALAREADKSEEQIIAALLHDIGHFCTPEGAAQMDGYGTADHEGVGARFLADFGFSELVQNLVHGHVEAKRYLVATKPEYLDGVSHASQETLKRQCGSMTAEEIKAFEQDPLFHDKLLLRSWDDAGKVEGLDIPPLSTYRNMLMTHLSSVEQTG